MFCLWAFEIVFTPVHPSDRPAIHKNILRLDIDLV